MVACALVFVLLAGISHASAEDGPVVRRCPIKVIHRATLASEQTGIVGSDVPQEGDVVVAGDVIVKLRDDIPKAANTSAQLQADNEIPIRSAENALELAELEYERSLMANRRTRGTVSEIEVMRLQLAAKQAEFDRQQAVADQQLAISRASETKAQLDSYAITAPFSGEVVRVFKSRGEAVRQGDPILEVVNVDEVRIEVDMPIQYRSSVQQGSDVQVFATTPTAVNNNDFEKTLPNTWVGTVSFISPTAEPITQTLLVYVTVENNDKLLIPGMAADVVLPASVSVAQPESSQP